MQNFCSFLEREHGKMEVGHKSDKSNESGGSSRANLLTPPSSNESTVSLSSCHNSTAYHRLPSNQPSASYGHLDCLKEECISELQRLSATRIERLARSLHHIRPLHLIFRDHSFYQHRPTITLFWFTKLLRSSLRSLTLDCIQGESIIPLSRLFSLEGIDKLTVKQPPQRAAIRVNIELFVNWLNLDAKQRRPIQVELLNCRDITPQSLAHFVYKWRKTSEICMFKSIKIDCSSMRVADLVRELENPQGHYNAAEEDENWRPLTPPQPALGHGVSFYELEQKKKVLHLRHFKQHNAYIEYRIVNDMIILTCKREDVIRVKNNSTSSMSSVGCKSSSSHSKRKASKDEIYASRFIRSFIKRN
ncbi:hypothetical protein WR25_01550 [Diploscapter pachys]|uniref:Uncharacterized protein n=1 Tax=Diploscapter pachys TaxID=2018661 RepID=A0A2A2K5E6_9BILA|nr:hypothetical protein WR25_01550 [Diploscapter pachys]